MRNKETIRLQYELFGSEVKVLADEHGLDPNIIEYAIDQENWTRKPVAQATRDWEGLDNIADITEGLLEQVHHRAEVLQTIKQSSLDPQYIKVESMLLAKAQDILRSINAESPTAPIHLKQVADVYKEMVALTSTHMRKENKNNGASKNNGITLNIQNNFDNYREEAKPALIVN